MLKLQVHIGLYICLATATCCAYSQGIVINEVQYQNNSTLYDLNDRTPDWIEIYNSGNETIQLEGYELSDDKDLNDRWPFPNIEIAPGEFLIVYASGENTISGKEIHTDFKLGLMNDPLYLINPGNLIIDYIPIQCIPPDKALGCYPNGSSEKVILHPSPGVSNNNSQQEEIHFQKDTLTISDPGGFYPSEITLELKNNHSNNYITYTLNGDDPEVTSERYSVPITLNDISDSTLRFADKGDNGYTPGDLISKANILRARVYSHGCPASNEISTTYFISNTEAFNYEVPVVSLITDKNNLFDDETGIYTFGNHSNCNRHGKAWERPVHIEVYDKNQPIINQHAGVRIHGRGSRNAPQKSLRLYARDEYGTSEFNYPLFSQKPQLNSFKTLLLRSTRGWSGTLFKDEMCQYLVQDMDMDYAAGETVVLFINGEYWGIYSLRERHDEHYVANNYHIKNPELDIIGYDMDNILIESGDINAYNELVDLLEHTDPSAPDFFNELSGMIDIHATIDFFITELYLANTDFPYNNLELWRFRNDTSKWRYFFFDLDGAMYRINYNHLAEYNNTYDDFQRFPDYSTLILRALLNNTEFSQIFNATFRKHLHSTFSPQRVISLIDTYQKLYEPLVAEQVYRWGNPADFNKWLHNVDMLRLFAMERPLVMQEQLNENFKNPFILYPNPSNGNFSVRFFTNSNKTISILNMQGQTIFKQPFYEGDVFIEELLNNGLYILRIDMDGYSYTQPINIVR